MSEIPAEWLEKMAAETAKRMKKDPIYGSGEMKQLNGVQILSEWFDFQAIGPKNEWDVGEYLAVMQTSRNGTVIRGVRHKGRKEWYYLNNVRISPWSNGGRIFWICRVNFNIPGNVEP